MEFTEILRGRYGLSERAAGVLMRHASQSVHARKGTFDRADFPRPFYSSLRKHLFWVLLQKWVSSMPDT